MDYSQIKEDVKNYLAGLPSAKARADAAYAVSQAYAEYLKDSGGLAAPGEYESWALTNDEAVDHSIRAASFDRGVLPTMDPFDALVRDRASQQPSRPKRPE